MTVQKFFHTIYNMKVIFCLISRKMNCCCDESGFRFTHFFFAEIPHPKYSHSRKFWDFWQVRPEPLNCFTLPSSPANITLNPLLFPSPSCSPDPDPSKAPLWWEYEIFQQLYFRNVPENCNKIFFFNIIFCLIVFF